MNITCNVIRDILPLYAENLVGGDTRALVEGHLAGCEACRNQLLELQQPQEIPADTNAAPLKKIRKTILQNKIKAAVITAGFVLAVAVTVFAWLTARQYYPYAADIVQVAGQADGSVLITFREDVTGYDLHRYATEDGKELAEITAWNTYMGKYVLQEREHSVKITPEGDEINAVYYYAQGEDNTLVYHKNYQPEGGVMTLPRLVLNYYALAAFLAALAGGVIIVILRKKDSARKLLVKLELIPISYLIGHVCIKIVSGDPYAAQRDFCLVLLVALLVYCASYAAVRLAERRGDSQQG